MRTRLLLSGYPDLPFPRIYSSVRILLSRLAAKRGTASLGYRELTTQQELPYTGKYNPNQDMAGGALTILARVLAELGVIELLVNLVSFGPRRPI